MVGTVVFLSVTGGFGYYWWNQKQEGIKRAAKYEKTHEPKERRPLLPEEFQP